MVQKLRQFEQSSKNGGCRGFSEKCKLGPNFEWPYLLKYKDLGKKIWPVYLKYGKVCAKLCKSDDMGAEMKNSGPLWLGITPAAFYRMKISWRVKKLLRFEGRLLHVFCIQIHRKNLSKIWCFYPYFSIF